MEEEWQEEKQPQNRESKKEEREREQSAVYVHEDDNWDLSGKEREDEVFTISRDSIFAFSLSLLHTRNK